MPGLGPPPSIELPTWLGELSHDQRLLVLVLLVVVIHMMLPPACGCVRRMLRIGVGLLLMGIILLATLPLLLIAVAIRIIGEHFPWRHRRPPPATSAPRTGLQP